MSITQIFPTKKNKLQKNKTLKDKVYILTIEPHSIQIALYPPPRRNRIYNGNFRCIYSISSTQRCTQL